MSKNIKSLSSGGCNHTRVTDYNNYLQSSEHQRIVSLLLGDDTTYESPRSWNSNASIVHDNKQEVVTTTQDNLYFFSDSLPQPNNCKPTYATMGFCWSHPSNEEINMMIMLIICMYVVFSKVWIKTWILLFVHYNLYFHNNSTSNLYWHCLHKKKIIIHKQDIFIKR